MDEIKDLINEIRESCICDLDVMKEEYTFEELFQQFEKIADIADEIDEEILKINSDWVLTPRNELWEG